VSGPEAVTERVLERHFSSSAESDLDTRPRIREGSSMESSDAYTLSLLKLYSRAISRSSSSCAIAFFRGLVAALSPP
jgi:hypothetical protein